MITIISPTRIEVDGKDAGLPVDYILANPGAKREINAAFIAWHESHLVAEAEYKRVALEAVAQAVAAKDEIRRAADEEIAAIKADMDILGTKEQAEARRAEQECARLRQTMSEAAAQLAVLQAKR